MPKILLALDIGTTAIKAGCFTPGGEILGMAYVEYPLIQPARWHVEQDANLWWELSRLAIRQVLAQDDVDPTAVAAIGISAQGIASVPVDEAGQPLYNAFSWLDTRAVDQVQELSAFFSSPADAFQRVGLHLMPAYTLPKIMWLRDHHPTVFQEASHFCTSLDFINKRLVDRYVTDHSIAGGTLAHNLTSLAWDDAVLEAMDVPRAKLPAIDWSGTPLGGLRPHVAAELGLPQNVEVVLGGHDQEVAALGAGIRRDEVSISLGTASILVAPLDKPVFDPEMRVPCYPHVERGQFVFEAVVNAGGVSFQWLRDLFNIIARDDADSYDYDMLTSLAAGAPNGANDLFFYPHLTGATSPFWNPDVSGVLYGLSLASGRDDIVRAVLEGWCFQLKSNLVTIEELTSPRENVIVFGGGTRSLFIQQLLANVLDRPVVVSPTSETALLGAAILAGLGCGIYNDLDEAKTMVRQGAKVVSPQPSAARDYHELFQSYREFENHLLNVSGSEEKDWL
jgi:sugar (pentulose or hexulose) kinase